MAEHRSRWRWFALPVAALVIWFLVRGGHGSDPTTGSSPSRSRSPSSSPSPSSPSPSRTPRTQQPTTPSSPNPAKRYDPADYAPQVRARAAQVGTSPRLLMAILYNEAYKPHDPDLERAWQRYKPDAAFGIANMHRAAFEETKRGRDFAGRRWDELPDDRDLAIEAAAWHLHDLARQLPARWPGPYTKDELLALGYNTGAGNMLAFARGAPPGSQAKSYLEKLRRNWPKAGDAVAAHP